MASSDHLSPAQLRAHVEWHKERWPEQYDTPSNADGNCYHASCGYLDSLTDHGHTGRLQAYEVPDDVEHVPHHPHHFVVHVETSKGPYVVDMTHRQFTPKAPYPLIEPKDRFEKRRSMRLFTRYDDWDSED